MRRRLLMGKGASDKYANYMTIRALEDGLEAVVGSANGEPIYYCIHSEGVWKKADMVTPAINAGDAISFKAEITPNSTVGCGNFEITRACALEGNCMSLLYGDNAEGQPMKAYGFYKLFNNCTLIRKVSKDFLPATTLANYCYSYMFNGVTQLTQPPDLPATTLAVGCYHTMFSGCIYMYESPLLPAKKLVSQCYAQMFYYCTGLKKITAMFTTTPSSSYTSNWVSNVASTGKFVMSKNATWSVKGVNGIPTNWTVEKV